MRRRWRILIGFLALLIVGAIGGLEYVNRVVLPVKVRGWAEQTASQALGRTVTIQKIRIHLWYGILLDGVTVSEDARYGQKPFLEIEQISGQVLILPLFNKKQIVIPSLRIVRPAIQLIQDPNGLWNMQSLILSHESPPSKSEPENKTSGLHLVVPRVVIEDGQLTLFLQKSPSPFKLHFEHVGAEAHLALPAQVRWSVQTHPAAGAAEEIHLAGSYDLQKHLFSMQNRFAVSLKTVLPLLPQRINSSFSAADGILAADFSLIRPREGPFTLKGSLQTKELHWKMRLRSPLGRGPNAANHLEGQGNCRLDFSGQFPPKDPATPWAGWHGTLVADKLAVGPLPWVGQLRDIVGQMEITPDGVRTEQMTATLSSGENLSLSGSLLNDEQKTIRLLIKSTLLLQQLPPLPDPFQAWIKKAKPTGETALEAIVEGTLRPSLSLQPTITGNFHGASFLCPGLGLLQQISGKIRWQPDLLTVTKLTGQYQEQAFQCEGSLVNFSQPEIDAHAAWGPLSFDTRLSVDGKQIEVHSFSGQYGQGTFRVFGQIGLENEPVGNLYGEASVLWEELGTLVPHPPTWLKTFPLKGNLSGRWILEGPLLKPQECTIGIKATSPRLLYQDVPLEQFSMDLMSDSGRISVRSAKATVAEGAVSAHGDWAYQKSLFPWKAGLKAEGVELAALARDLKWQTEKLSGQMNLEWSGQGESSGLDSIQGNGTIHIGGGRIAELPLLGQFADFLGIPTLRTIMLQEAQGAFRIEHGTIQSDGLQIRAPQASLNILGSGGFLQGKDSPIDWRIVPTLAPELIPEDIRSRIGRAIAHGTSYLIGEVRIKGTWKNPKRTFTPKPITQILNDQIFNLQDLFKQLF